MGCSKGWYEMQTNYFRCLGSALVKDLGGEGRELKEILCYLASPLDLLSTSLVFEDTPQWPGLPLPVRSHCWEVVNTLLVVVFKESHGFCEGNTCDG